MILIFPMVTTLKVQHHHKLRIKRFYVTIINNKRKLFRYTKPNLYLRLSSPTITMNYAIQRGEYDRCIYSFYLLTVVIPIFPLALARLLYYRGMPALKFQAQKH